MTFCGILTMLLVCHAMPAEASLFKGEMLDKVADVMSWVVLIVGPVIGIVIFWLLHILPEKIAEKKKHPQAAAIQTLCLLSLFFGGMLWPFAWLWAYTKPVLHKMAYGTDTVEHEHGGQDIHTKAVDDADEVRRLRARLAELEAKQAMEPPVTLGGRV
jgi:CBS domain containing-hemolysin-like protein